MSLILISLSSLTSCAFSLQSETPVSEYRSASMHIGEIFNLVSGTEFRIHTSKEAVKVVAHREQIVRYAHRRVKIVEQATGEFILGRDVGTYGKKIQNGKDLMLKYNGEKLYLSDHWAHFRIPFIRAYNTRPFLVLLPKGHKVVIHGISTTLKHDTLVRVNSGLTEIGTKAVNSNGYFIGTGIEVERIYANEEVITTECSNITGGGKKYITDVKCKIIREMNWICYDKISHGLIVVDRNVKYTEEERIYHSIKRGRPSSKREYSTIEH